METSSIADFREKLNRKIEDRRTAKYQIAQEQENLTAIRRRLRDTTRAQEIMQSVAQELQNKVHKQISQVVSNCLSAVFDESFEFEIRFEKKRGKTEAVMLLKQDGNLLEDPEHEVGGSVLDVAAFALRIASILLRRPKVRHLIICDEPFRFVDAENRLKVRAMMEALSEELNFQIILVTHAPELITGKVIEVGK